MTRQLIRRTDASELVFNILMWSVFSLLITRLFLSLTDYPQIARGSWHIAHIFWGGLVMFFGGIIPMVYYGKKSLKLSSVLMGLGLGLFLDETGKFISKDNDYFFRPAVMMVYVFFISLFLFYRYLKIDHLNLKGRLFSVIEDLESTLDGVFDDKTKKNILAKINKEVVQQRGDDKVLILKIKEAVESRTPVNAEFNNRLLKLPDREKIIRIFNKKPVFYALIVYTLFWSADKIWDLLILFKNKNILVNAGEVYNYGHLTTKTELYLSAFIIFSDTLAAIIFMLGLYLFFGKKKSWGIRLFRQGLLINIFLISVFRFYFEQLGAMFSLAVSILTLIVLNNFRSKIPRKVKNVI